MYLGVDYYPEQWDPSLMEQDLDTIVELGCNVIRIGEFAWHLMEKTEGQYDFSFFDEVISAAKKRGLWVIFGTPTATIPAWLAKKEPSIISEFENGQKRVFGGRHNYCFNSPVMYDYSEKIIRALVEHYKDEEAIVAWQIDNEIGHEGSDVCYCSQCQQAFQNYLRREFKNDIHSLNDTMGTTFWSQEYNDFDEINTPTETITTHNPSLRLYWERFRSESIVHFMEFQYDLVRSILPEAVIMHDFPGGGFNKHVDYSKVAAKLDQVAYNNYPVWGGQKEPLPPHEIAFQLDYIRGLKGENFWITEAIMGAQGHDVTGYSPRPNQAKMWSYQGLAHGCDSLLYFRYRGATKGAEQFCYGVLDADNVKRRKFYEVQSLFQEVRPFADTLAAPVQAKVGLVYDYDSFAAFRIQKQSFLLDLPAEMQKYYKVFYDDNIPVDVIPQDRDFSPYQILILNQLIIQKPELTAKLKAFVEAGGTLILTYRTFVKDIHNNLTFGKAIPVDWAEYAGVTVVETESLQEGQEFPLVNLSSGQAKTEGEGSVFRDLLEVTDAEVLAQYGDEFYRQYAAITCKKQGKGMVYYVGCSVDYTTLQGLLSRVLTAHQIEGTPSPEGVEIAYRGEGEHRIRMILNHNGTEVPFEGGTLAAYACYIEKA